MEAKVTMVDDRVKTERVDAEVVAEATLRTLWESALCRTAAKDDERWLTDEHTVQREAERAAIARELWKTVCSDCPVWRECLRWAIENEEVGIWAGTTRWQRKRMGRTAGGNMTLDMTHVDDEDA